MRSQSQFEQWHGPRFVALLASDYPQVVVDDGYTTLVVQPAEDWQRLLHANAGGRPVVLPYLEESALLRATAIAYSSPSSRAIDTHLDKATRAAPHPRAARMARSRCVRSAESAPFTDAGLAADKGHAATAVADAGQGGLELSQTAFAFEEVNNRAASGQRPPGNTRSHPVHPPTGSTVPPLALYSPAS